MHVGINGCGLTKPLVASASILLLAGAGASSIVLNGDAFTELGLHFSAIQNNPDSDDSQGRLGAYPLDDATIGTISVNGAIVGHGRRRSVGFLRG